MVTFIPCSAAPARRQQSTIAVQSGCSMAALPFAFLSAFTLSVKLHRRCCGSWYCRRSRRILELLLLRQESGRIRVEEKALEAQFGKEYADYKRSTYRLFPYIF